MTHTRYDYAATGTIFILYSLDSHIQGGNAVIEVLLRESSQTELFKSVIGIGDQFPEENLPKGIGSGSRRKEETRPGTYLSKD